MMSGSMPALTALADQGKDAGIGYAGHSGVGYVGGGL
jgi:hypothetical protein